MDYGTYKGYSLIVQFDIEAWDRVDTVSAYAYLPDGTIGDCISLEGFYDVNTALSALKSSVDKRNRTIINKCNEGYRGYSIKLNIKSDGFVDDVTATLYGNSGDIKDSLYFTPLVSNLAPVCAYNALKQEIDKKFAESTYL